MHVIRISFLKLNPFTFPFREFLTFDMRSNRGCILWLLSFLVGSAHADPLDDFTNNLLSDLAPYGLPHPMSTQES